MIAASLLHDLFKYYQYEYDEVVGGFRQREDWYLQHDFALVAELSHRKSPEYLIRVCAEAHGFNVLAPLKDRSSIWPTQQMRSLHRRFRTLFTGPALILKGKQRVRFLR